MDDPFEIGALKLELASHVNENARIRAELENASQRAFELETRKVYVLTLEEGDQWSGTDTSVLGAFASRDAAKAAAEDNERSQLRTEPLNWRQIAAGGEYTDAVSYGVSYEIAEFEVQS